MMKFRSLARNVEIGANSYLLTLGETRVLLDAGMHPKQEGTNALPEFGSIDYNSIDAAIAARRLKAMVNSVCPDDPRTLAQKRADAFGAVFAGAFHLSCLCGNPDCPVAAVPDARATSVTVHVVADHTSLTATPDPALHGNGDTPNTDAEAEPERTLTLHFIGVGGAEDPSRPIRAHTK